MSSNEPGPASEPAPARPGRKLGRIVDTAGSAHRAWLVPTRERYLASGRTLSELGLSVPLAKSKLSELLRGVGHYPRWEVVHRLARELDIPVWPLHRLWKEAALDVGKSRDWVDRSTEGAIALTTARSGPPLDHGALRIMVTEDYRLYAGNFLYGEARDAAVEDTFAMLWLTWDEALASPDTRRYAWNILRTTVRSRAGFRDDRPVLTDAAFDTVALRTRTSTEGQAAQLTESLELFAAISRLPDAQLDVMVLRRLCGFTAEEVSDLLGIPLAAVRSDERHAERFLDDTIETHVLPPQTGGATP
ncbi:sigma-70 family RNA polymerase sigma factor [Streptomyces jumonjinensis]|uniref:Sigma-70 family RNA polymerase sigma factor n=1 Tax=Streptomyces jumonjinensis TaxID=1945 RepID=A0A646KKE4_STRJU|nr:sigma-70 family RNA polymerase sigma factor [Streptomyces jumonjinensis]MQT02752.1 sigma-70 family RNA polymerase sigma factor [Streptomyces jumonjinensis]